MNGLNTVRYSYLVEHLLYQVHYTGGVGKVMLPSEHLELGPVYWCPCEATAGRLHVVSAPMVDAVVWGKFTQGLPGMADATPGGLEWDVRKRREVLGGVVVRVSVVGEDLGSVGLHPRLVKERQAP